MNGVVPKARCSHSCIFYEGFLFIFGGVGAGGLLNDLHIYDTGKVENASPYLCFILTPLNTQLLTAGKTLRLVEMYQKHERVTVQIYTDQKCLSLADFQNLETAQQLCVGLTLVCRIALSLKKIY